MGLKSPYKRHFWPNVGVLLPRKGLNERAATITDDSAFQFSERTCILREYGYNVIVCHIHMVIRYTVCCRPTGSFARTPHILRTKTPPFQAVFSCLSKTVRLHSVRKSLGSAVFDNAGEGLGLDGSAGYSLMIGRA